MARDEKVMVDLTINSDLVDTRGPGEVAVDPQKAMMKPVGFRAKPAWMNQYHGYYNIMARNGSYKYISVHYTAAQSPAAGNALANCKYFAAMNRSASAHYFIDDSGVWEYADPDDYCTWHVGDGHGINGITNYNSIGIEVCQQGDQDYSEKEKQHLTTLVQWLMAQYNIPAERVTRHFDASSKLCPLWFAGASGARKDRWNQLWTRITSGAGADPNWRPVLGEGDTGEYVKKLQELLISFGYSLDADGSFGPATREAVMAFQRDEGLEADGYCGPLTWGALEGEDMAVTDHDIERFWSWPWRGPNGTDVKQGDRLANMSDQMHNYFEKDVDPAGTGRPKPESLWDIFGAVNTTEIKDQLVKVQEQGERTNELLAELVDAVRSANIAKGDWT